MAIEVHFLTTTHATTSLPTVACAIVFLLAMPSCLLPLLLSTLLNTSIVLPKSLLLAIFFIPMALVRADGRWWCPGTIRWWRLPFEERRQALQSSHWISSWWLKSNPIRVWLDHEWYNNFWTSNLELMVGKFLIGQTIIGMGFVSLLLLGLGVFTSNHWFL